MHASLEQGQRDERHHVWEHDEELIGGSETQDLGADLEGVGGRGGVLLQGVPRAGIPSLVACSGAQSGVA